MSINNGEKNTDKWPFTIKIKFFVGGKTLLYKRDKICMMRLNIWENL